MKRIPSPGATQRARTLRRNRTEAEAKLWRLLRESFPGWHWRFQVPIHHYIADFASHRAKLIIEADGGQHDAETDAPRMAVLEADGYQVLRFWNNDVLANPDGCAQVIAAALAERSPLPALPIKGGLEAS